MRLLERLLRRYDRNENLGNEISAEENHLSIDYLSRSTVKTQLNNADLQKGGEYISHSVDFLLDCYSNLIIDLIKTLPLSASEVDYMILPMVGNVIRFVHLLPASEAHHHATPGGLLMHLLEGATYAARIAEGVSFVQSESLQKKYEQKTAWIIAASVLFLIHDLGKVGDIVVSSRDGDVWNPELETLVAWSDRLQIGSYGICWRSEREHKKHELRSLRYAYKQVLTTALLDYLGLRGGCDILDAIERAIVFNEGVLATILQRADARSVQVNIESNRRSQNLSSRSSPVVGAILSAIKELVQNGFWKTNCREAPVFVTDQGLFVVVRNETVRDIREQAVGNGLDYVPGTIAGMLKVLDEAGLLLSRYEYVQSTVGRDLLWQIDVGKLGSHGFHREFFISSCICFPDPTQVLTTDLLQRSLSIDVQIAETETLEETDLRRNKKQEGKLFVAPESDFLTIGKQASDIRTNKKCSVASENKDIPMKFLTVSDETMGTEEVKDFLAELTNLLIEHMRIGGAMAVDCHKDLDGNVRCKSIKFEEILTNKKVARSTVEIYLRLRKDKPKIFWDIGGGFFILCSGKDLVYD